MIVEVRWRIVGDATSGLRPAVGWLGDAGIAGDPLHQWRTSSALEASEQTTQTETIPCLCMLGLGERGGKAEQTPFQLSLDLGKFEKTPFAICRLGNFPIPFFCVRQI